MVSALFFLLVNYSEKKRDITQPVLLIEIYVQACLYVASSATNGTALLATVKCNHPK